MAQIDSITRKIIEQNFELTGNIVEGGFGSIIKAIDRKTKRTVAIKLLKQKPLSAQDTQLINAKLIHEAALAGRLTHPGIVRIIGVEIEPISYLVSEWIDGRTLLERVPIRSFTVILELLIEIGEALAFAHRFDVAHLDISPRNIMFDSSDHIRIVDFGLASAHNDNLIEAGGTAGFIAPEIMEGMPGDKHSDVYSFGALGYWLLAEVLPPKDYNDRYALLTNKRPEVSAEFIDIIFQCLSQVPEERPSSLVEVVNMLRESYPRLINITSAGDEIPKWQSSILWRIIRYISIRCIILFIIIFTLVFICEFLPSRIADNSLLIEKLCKQGDKINSMSNLEMILLWIAGLLFLSILIRLLREIKHLYNIRLAISKLKNDRYKDAATICQKAMLWRRTRVLVTTYANACAAMKRCDRMARAIYEQAFNLGAAAEEVKSMLKVIYENMSEEEDAPPGHIASSLAQQSEKIFLKRNFEGIDWNCKEDIEYDRSKYEHKFSEEKVISATQILHGERNGSNVIDAEDNQIIQNTGYTVKKLTDVPNVTNISSRTMLHKPCHKVLDSLKGHLIVADDLICGNMFCNPSYGLWFIGFSLSVLFAYIRIEKSDTIVSLIFGSIFYIIIGGCFGTGLSLVMNAICCFLNLYPAYRFNKYLWRHIGRRNSKAIFNMIKRMGVTVSEYCWAMQLTLPPGSVWRYIVENAVAENDRKKKKRLIAYRKVTTSDILIILFLATLFLFNIYIILYGSDEEGTVSSSVIAIIDSMILFWAFIGIWTIRRVVWISREASVLGFIRSETSRGTFKPVLSIPGLFFIRTGELAQKGINYTVLAILAFLMSLTKRKK